MLIVVYSKILTYKYYTAKMSTNKNMVYNLYACDL